MRIVRLTGRYRQTITLTGYVGAYTPSVTRAGQPIGLLLALTYAE